MGGGTSPGPSAGQPANGPYYSSSNAGNMNNSEELHHPQRYPSPNAAQLGQGGGPFFGQPPHRLSPPDNMQLAAAQLSRSAAPMMAPSMADNQEPAAMNAASNEQTQPSNSPGAVGQDVNRELNSEEKTAPRKRSKTSRACDECRRKKVSPHPMTVNACCLKLINLRYVATPRKRNRGSRKNPAPIASVHQQYVNSAGYHKSVGPVKGL